MVEPYINEKDLIIILERLETTIELGKKHGIAFSKLGNVYQDPFNVIMAVSSERLDKSSKMLNSLTAALIILTSILTIVGILNIVI